MWCNTFEQEQTETTEQRLPPFSVLPSVRIVLATLALLAFGTPRAQPGFQAPLSFDVGSSPVAVVVGDFNGDGIPDLAVANRDSNNVSVLLGKEDGTFQAALPCAVGSRPYALSTADFNRDGIPDLAVVDAGAAVGVQGSVGIMLGKGDGTFQPAVAYAAGLTPSAVAVGDFNGDGIPDLA